MSEIILEGRGLTRRYKTDTGQTLTASNGVDLALHKGKTLGIVGESGCGKSTLLRMLTQIERPDEGKLFYYGKDITSLKGEALRKHRRHIQMVFQNSTAAFFPKMKVSDAISEPLRNFKHLSKREVDSQVSKLLEMVELPESFAERYPHSMSGGQRQRLGIARALALNPDVLVCDEATCSLDVSVQQRIIQLLARIQKERQLSIIFVCHDLALVQSISHQVMVMYLGNVVETLPGDQVWEKGCHPYSKALLGSVFAIDMDFDKPLSGLEGDIPSPLDLPKGCPFHTRCPQCMDRCRQERPVLRTVGSDHQVSCHLYYNEVKECM